ncbi:hypothetical protein D3870_04405 [Noviherbaspirillum cavernae]|uniref:DUF6471 domain-containing protein n=1 Tax=Noviherbaspirillum cavernae TaxID=2320862 RepID=A0A418WYV9_9BURK|nr:DUF6471 domain-containing protein [Noviherbaspirillum cavernae]RJG05361.1 hypothetical protein D3870_04405 [Noviherbaspirillum cavernae]
MLKPGRPISLSSKPGRKTESVAVEEWSWAASLMVKRAMHERDWSYKELSDALSLLGIKRSATAINRRINRGNFSAGFLLACLHVMQAPEIAEKP